ncbi:MAG: hypothetical protein CSA74_06925 [Rhodobacterales bacterium]|nr:MAG: hypothetical protein CSA74_06925 [Rhodobacterales bacterium]
MIFEVTGPYHGAFERRLAGHLPVVKVNPLQARRFAQALGTRAKTDRVDAVVLAQMGAAPGLQPDAPAREDQHDLKELQAARTALVKDRTGLLNRIRTQTLALTRHRSRALLRRIEAALKEIEAEIKTRLRASDEGALVHDILCPIPGIGEPTAAAILIECPETGTLGRKQIASLAGLAPMTRQSGQWRGQAFIRGGRKFLRDALCMPALVAWSPKRACYKDGCYIACSRPLPAVEGDKRYIGFNKTVNASGGGLLGFGAGASGGFALLAVGAADPGQGDGIVFDGVENGAEPVALFHGIPFCPVGSGAFAARQ